MESPDPGASQGSRCHTWKERGGGAGGGGRRALRKVGSILLPIIHWGLLLANVALALLLAGGQAWPNTLRGLNSQKEL